VAIFKAVKTQSNITFFTPTQCVPPFYMFCKHSTSLTARFLLSLLYPLNEILVPFNEIGTVLYDKHKPDIFNIISKLNKQIFHSKHYWSSISTDSIIFLLGTGTLINLRYIFLYHLFKYFHAMGKVTTS
jgi:hypothetical protein